MIDQQAFSSDAEQSVLGGLMLDSKAWDVCGHLVKAEHFHFAGHSEVFTAIANLAKDGKPTDAVTVSHELGNDLAFVGGMAYLGELVKNTASTSNIAQYAKIVAERALYRCVISAHREAYDVLVDAEKPLEARTRSAANMIIDAMDGHDTDSAVPLLHESAREWVESLERIHESGSSITGVATGFTDLDNALKGLEPGEITIIAARPSMGKSAFALNICSNIANAGGSVFVSSMEMPIRAIHNRLAASTSHISYESVRQAKMAEIGPGLYAYAARMREWKLAVDARPTMDLNRLEISLRQHKRRHGLTAAMIDYLGLMQMGDNPNRANAIADLTGGIKRLAGILDIPIILLAQLNRDLEKRADRRPIMADLRDSGAIEQDAHTILFLYRDSVYNESTPFPEYTECIIGKARDSERGYAIPLHTKLDQMRFGNVDWHSLPANWRNMK